MHVIPESWPHAHLLVSVFPSVGLIFALGLYVTAFLTKDELMKRNCLIIFGILGLLAIPTYISGIDSLSAIAKDPKLNQDTVDAHQMWGDFGLVMLLLTGAVAFFELWRFRRLKRLSNNALHLVLGLAIVTLGLMIVLANLGWNITHHEFPIPNEPGHTPEAWAHTHVILNHFPTVGFVFTLAYFIAALVMKNLLMRRVALVMFVVCAILGIPTYVTGAAAMWALTDRPLGISMAAINAHRDMALLSLFGMGFTGVTAWLQIWRFRYTGQLTKGALYLTLLFGVLTLAAMSETGHRGGQINHPEIRVEALPTDAAAYWSPQIEKTINNVIWFVPWQTVHFIGYSLVFGVVLIVMGRVLGFWKSIPFSAVHRLLPIGVFGVAMNVFTGMLMLMADTFRYVNDTTFAPKMFLLPIGAVAVLYFSLSDKLWATKAGEDAPMQAKWVACITIIAWTGVIMGGRLLPYL